MYLPDALYPYGQILLSMRKRQHPLLATARSEGNGSFTVIIHSRVHSVCTHNYGLAKLSAGFHVLCCTVF